MDTAFRIDFRRIPILERAEHWNAVVSAIRQPLCSGKGGTVMTFDIILLGFISVRHSDGKDCTPRSTKARALLALLALSPDRARSRRWLEAMLWSDRAEAQAQGSLRQALLDLRRSCPSGQSFVEADREKIWLIQDRVWIDVSDDFFNCVKKFHDGSELMEGLFVRGEEFEDWLRMERSRFVRNIGNLRLVENSPRMTSGWNTNRNTKKPVHSFG